MNTSTLVRDRAVVERVRYFSRQLLTADDMTADQEYFRQKLRRHNRFLHGWGVVCGCEVNPVSDVNPPWTVTVCPGYVMTPQGDEILIAREVCFDLSSGWSHPDDPCAKLSPCPPTGRRVAGDEDENYVVYLAVCYAECDAKPVRVHPAGCGCDASGCEYSRIRDSFELVVLTDLPKSHTTATGADVAWCTKITEWGDTATKGNPVPDCIDASNDPCVVLARITLPTDDDGHLNRSDRISKIDYLGRRPLYSVSALDQLVTCLGQSQ